MKTDELKSVTKDQIQTLSKTLTPTDISFLVETLSEKDGKLRYNAFLLLQANSRMFPFVYQQWDDLEKKLESDNSYQRSLGTMLIAENVRWDKGDRFSKTISKYLKCCMDEKFITARQTIQGLETILKATNRFNEAIRRRLTELQLSQYKANQQKLINKDILNVLEIINKREKV